METTPTTDCKWIPPVVNGNKEESTHFSSRDREWFTGWGYFVLKNDSLALVRNLEFGTKLGSFLLAGFPEQVIKVQPVEQVYMQRTRVRLVQWMERFFVSTCLQPNPGLSIGGLVFAWYTLVSIFWSEVEMFSMGPLYVQRTNARINSLAPRTSCPELGLQVYLVELQHSLAPPQQGAEGGSPNAPVWQYKHWVEAWYDRVWALWRQCAPLLLPLSRLKQLSWYTPRGQSRTTSTNTTTTREQTPDGSIVLLLEKVSGVGFWIESQLAVLQKHTLVDPTPGHLEGYVTHFHKWMSDGLVGEPDSSVDQYFRNLCYAHHLGACTLQAYLRKNPVQSVHTPMVTVMNDTLHPEYIHKIQRAFAGAGIGEVCNNTTHPYHNLGVVSWFQHWFKIQFHTDWAKAYLVHGYTWLDTAPLLYQAKRQHRTRRPLVVFLLDRWFVQVCTEPLLLLPAPTTSHALVIWLLFLYCHFSAELENGDDPMFAQIELVCGLGPARRKNLVLLQRMFTPVLASMVNTKKRGKKKQKDKSLKKRQE